MPDGTPLGLMMPETSEKQLSGEQSRLVAAIIREQLARRRMSRQHLADQAKISISTLEKALSGRRPFTLATTVRLEEALGVSLRKGEPAADLGAAPANLAPGHLGFYSRPAVSWIEGSYVTLRPSFSDPQAIFAYRTEICWDEGVSSLIFRESDRVDAEFSQQGLVSVPHQSGHIYLVTNRQGQYRLVIISRPTINGEMFGIMTTLAGRPRLGAHAGIGADRLRAGGHAAEGRVRPHPGRAMRAISSIASCCGERSRNPSPCSCRSNAPLTRPYFRPPRR